MRRNGARPVWSGGKSGDDFKGLPITINDHLWRLCPQQPDRRRTFPGPGKLYGTVRLHQPEQGGKQPVPPDD